MEFPENLWKQTVLAILVTLTGASSIAFAAEKSGGSLTGNIAATSTYVWRGLPQTVDAALQGGIDYSIPFGSMPFGLHVGAWTSNVAGGSELDVIVGFAGKVKGFSYDAGLIVYNYPQYEAAAGPGEDFNFNELYASISKDMLNARFSTSVEAGNYIEINANFEKIAPNLDLGLHFGSYDVDTGFYGTTLTGLTIKNYNDYNVSVATDVNGFDVSFTLSDTSLDSDSYRTIITVSKDFTL